MKKDKIVNNPLFLRAMKAVKSCNRNDQLESAKKYCFLATNRAASEIYGREAFHESYFHKWEYEYDFLLLLEEAVDYKIRLLGE